MWPDERQRHARRHIGENVRLVSEQQHGIVGLHPRQRSRQIVDAAELAVPKPVGELIAEAGEPKPLPGLTEQHRVVFQDRQLRFGKRAAHAFEIVPPIVIAEDRPAAERRLESRQFGRPVGVGDGRRLERIPGPEIAKQHR